MRRRSRYRSARNTRCRYHGGLGGHAARRLLLAGLFLGARLQRNPYDRLRGYTNVNLTLIFTNQNGWQVMLYDKNVFNTTAITGDFLNSDDSGLTTNVFLTDPKLIGIRVTKNW